VTQPYCREHRVAGDEPDGHYCDCDVCAEDVLDGPACARCRHQGPDVVLVTYTEAGDPLYVCPTGSCGAVG
jgi:hypothetical protein